MRKDPITGKQAMHNGIDFGAIKPGVQGDPLYAVADGIVEAATGNATTGYGWYVIIKHADGCRTMYAHQQRLDVKAGQIVKAGQQIGSMGSSGNSTAAHLHFEVRTNATNQVNPAPYLLKEEESMNQDQFNAMMATWQADQAKKEASASLQAEFSEAKAVGITDGTRPQGLATREQVAAMALRAIKTAGRWQQ
jgi:hypothetical protein